MNLTPRQQLLIDVGLVLLLGVLFFLSAWPDDLVGAGIGLIYVGSLLWRHQAPFVVALIATVAYSTWVLAGYETHELGSLPAAVALYTLGQSHERFPLKVVGLAALVGSFLFIAVGLSDMAPLTAAFFVAIFVGVWARGLFVAGRRRYASELEERTRELEAARSALADVAVTEERARIARELHDVVSHSLSTMTLQAGVGAHLAESDPSRAAEALRVIESTGRATLDELRRVLGIIEGETSGKHPQPSLADIEPLVQRVRDSGLDVDLVLNGAPGQLPQMVEVSVYRIIQESLTNALKHATGGSATVNLWHGTDAIEVEVLSEGATSEPESNGMGLRGMSERVSLLGGEFEAGPAPDGWRVWAAIPKGER